MKLFLDTNILLDAIVKRANRKFSDDAKLILQLGKDGEIDLYMSALSIPTIAYVLKNMTSSSKKSIIKSLCEIVTPLPSHPEHIQPALDEKSHIKDIEDSLQIQSAKEGNCNLIITRNVPDFLESEIPAISPDDFLNRVLE